VSESGLIVVCRHRAPSLRQTTAPCSSRDGRSTIRYLQTYVSL
jgi:hypothetical protein